MSLSLIMTAVNYIFREKTLIVLYEITSGCSDVYLKIEV